MKLDKQKDTKSKQKQDLAKSTQNLIYMLSPLNTEITKSMSTISSQNEIERLQTIYQTEFDIQRAKPYLKTPYNVTKSKDGEIITYRSPYSNCYYPSVEVSQSAFPSMLVRNIQEKGELLFNQYAKMYYGDCISNFFVEENQEEFSFAYYVQKRFKDEDCEGIWNSTNIANIAGDPTKSISYKVSTSIMYELTCGTESDQTKPFTISGNLKRTKNESKKLAVGTELDDFHLICIGRIVEQNETYLRQQMEEVFARKTKQIVNKIRIAQTKEGMESQRKIMKQLLESTVVKKENAIQL